ncbi:MAG TPA: RDD family protein [Pyrinomonadaceae bacterium]|nr:RDD family protein [Pyrinomonadaceae bacterium]
MSLQLERERGAVVSRGTAVAPRAEVNFERLRAPFSLRCGALLIDYILLVGVLAAATILARFFGDARRASSVMLTAGYIAVAAVAFLNFVVIAALTGRTLGKWLAGLRIERKDGEPQSYARALVRHLVGYPLTLLTLGLGFLLAAFHPQGRALHDLLAGTVVVRSRRTR